jgi:hypothetical protein
VTWQFFAIFNVSSIFQEKSFRSPKPLKFANVNNKNNINELCQRWINVALGMNIGVTVPKQR